MTTPHTPSEILRTLKNTRDALKYCIQFLDGRDPIGRKVQATLDAADRAIQLADQAQVS